MEEVLCVKKLSDVATIPSKGSPYAAGYDLSSAVNSIIPARGRAVIPTDIAIAIPYGTYARVAARSGLAVKKGIDTGAGVIDYDYRGNVGVVLFNHTDEDFVVSVGDRVAQLVLERICNAETVVCSELPTTERGQKGFGSTGV